MIKLVYGSERTKVLSEALDIEQDSISNSYEKRYKTLQY
jgi:hypothetical protein